MILTFRAILDPHEIIV